MTTPIAIVIVHGLLGFGRTQALRTAHIYFAGLRGRLGPDVYFPTLPGSGTIADRARALADFLATLSHEQVAIIAHSMGGLDARHLIRHLDPDHRVRELITLSTPHHGSVIAEVAQHRRSPFYLGVRALTRPALDDLRPEACARFNLETPDRPDTRYRSYSASRPIEEMALWLRPFAREFGDESNDGLVSVTSGQWGEHVATLHADHFELAGWRILPVGAWRTPRWNHVGFYRGLVDELRSSRDAG